MNTCLQAGLEYMYTSQLIFPRVINFGPTDFFREDNY